jgi:hypothetical protein
VITSVDAEARHRDMSTIENEIFAEKRQSENGRDSEIEKRAAKLEQDLPSWRPRAPRRTCAQGQGGRRARDAPDP